MSGFDPIWLNLREPADIPARDVRLLGKAAALLGGPEAVVVDLGCGTGTTFRALAPLLPAPATWRLVDRDPALLDIARTRLGGQAEIFRLDLAQINALPLDNATLVTASALFDLCSADFIEKLASRLAQRGIGLYAALSYDGTIAWDPSHPLDAKIVELFNRHQRSDKGLGTALGPAAGHALMRTFTGLGYEVSCADSAWRVSPDMDALQTAFIDGIAAPVAETGLIEPSVLRAWRRWRLDALANGASCRVGHLDILAQAPSA